MGRVRVIHVAVLFLSLTTGLAVSGACGEDWSWANPLPQGNDLYGIATDGTTSLAVGSHGTVVRRSGSDYTVGDVGHPYWLSSVTYASGMWVAVGSDPETNTPIVTTSDDGLQWVTRSAGGVGHLFGVAYGGGRFVAVGYHWEGTRDIVFTSSNGYAWTGQTLTSGHVLTAVAYGSGRFVAASEGGALLSSTDGSTWTTAASFLGFQFRAITFASGTFVAVGYDWFGGHSLFAYSADGLAWTSVPSTFDADLLAVCYGGGQFLATGLEWSTGKTRCFGSPDGVVWSPLGTIPEGLVHGVVYAQGQYQVVGEAGYLGWSGDGLAWAKASTGVHREWSDLASGPDFFVAVGEKGTFAKSLDGETWAASSFSDGISLHGVAYGEGRFVAVGDGGDVKYSSDGAVWYYGASGTTDDLMDVASSGHTFVAGGLNGTLLWSDDGMTWTSLPSLTSHHIHAVTFGDGLFVAVTGAGESVMIGPSIVLMSTGSTDSLFGVAFGGSRFVAVGEGGRIVTLDTNGLSYWEERFSGVTDDLYSVAYGNGLFVAMGMKNEGEAFLLTSPDGITWTERDPGVGHPLLGAGGGRGLLFVLGDGGTILKSACPPSLSSLSPSRGSVAGGNTVVLEGTALQGADTVTFDGLPASFTETADGRIEALAPAHAEGPVTVLVHNLGGWSDALTYTYVQPPAITSVVKKTNPFRLVVSGSNFKNPCTVYAGGTAVPTTTYKSATKVVAKGSTLKTLFPKGIPVEVTVVNDADGVPSAPYLFSR